MINFPMPAADQTNPAPAAEAQSMSAVGAYRFPRPGQRPLVFTGTLLAMAMSFTPEVPYWYEINIFRTETQEFALVLKLFFQSEAEDDYSKAWSFESIEALFDALETYDAAEDIRVPLGPTDGAPPAELAAMAYEMKARVAAQRAHWASLIGELFDELEAAGQAMG
ncbi:hypothetical protein HKCCE3408_06160 [Rhodobacterales bacterium HKCCE3408]|nr:hypothetical protein [Rhodobacterales bacterium HKCCE3408]